MDQNPKKISLNDPALRGRAHLQTQARPITYAPRTTASVPSSMDMVVPTAPTQAPTIVIAPTPDPIPKPLAPIAPVTPLVTVTSPTPASISVSAPIMPEPEIPVIQPKPQTAGFVQIADQAKADPPKLRGISRHKVSMALTTLAVIAFGIGIFVGINSLRTNRYVSAQIASLHKSNDPNAPSEDAPNSGDLGSYKVPGTDPRILSIPKINVKTRVRKLGVKSDNELAAPSNIFDAGWYEGSSRPDEAGAMLIDGHVQGPTKPGVFMNLSKLSSGDKLTVERGDGKVYQYHVVKTQTFDSTNMDMQATLNSVDQDKNGLNIITCTGSYDTKSKNYTQRLVVFAVQD